MNEKNHGNIELFSKLSVAFVGFSLYLIVHQIDVTSRHYAVSFSIPIHNTGIYFNKLYSIRCLLILIGTIIEYFIFLIGGGDLGDKHEGETTRKYVSIFSLSVLLILRISLLATLYISSKLGYHVYITLSAEALIHGFFEDAFTALGAEYMSLLNFVYSLCRIFILIFQFLLDLMWFKNPLFMVKLQTWVCTISTLIALMLWINFNIFLKSQIIGGNNTHVPVSNKNGIHSEGGIKDGLDAVISPFVMFIAGSMFKDFLTPGTLPYALLERDKCHMINMFKTIISLLGPLILLLMDHLGAFKKWELYYNGFLALIVPMAIIFIYCFLAMHTSIPTARRIINSRPRVMTMTLVLVLCYGFLEPLNFVGIAKYAIRGNPYGYTIQGINNTVVLLSRSFFARVSVGYSDTRISLGYHLPRFRPTHRMSKSNLAWYIIRQTFSRAGKDAVNDFKMNIKDYL